jgi:hypothetical protein
VCPVDTIDGRDVLGDANEQRVLTASASADDLLAADGRVVDDCRLLDIVDGALAGLVVAAEAPRVDLAVLGDGEAVVETGLYGDDVGCLC